MHPGKEVFQYHLKLQVAEPSREPDEAFKYDVAIQIPARTK